MRRRTDRVAIASAVVCLICVAVIGFVIAPAILDVSQQQTAMARTQAEVARQAERADQLAEEIQEQRVNAIRTSCSEQNERHDRTIRTLDALLVKRVKEASGRKERVRLKASRASTVQLIEALAPKRDCAALVERSTSTP